MNTFAEEETAGLVSNDAKFALSAGLSLEKQLKSEQADKMLESLVEDKLKDKEKGSHQEEAIASICG